MNINIHPSFNQSVSSFSPQFSATTNSFDSNINTQVPIVADKTFVYRQRVASNIWDINHTLDKFPSVTVVDSGKNVVVGDITYIDKSHIQIFFTSAFVGTAYLN